MEALQHLLTKLVQGLLWLFVNGMNLLIIGSAAALLWVAIIKPILDEYDRRHKP